jgi:hypothetical protein
MMDLISGFIRKNKKFDFKIKKILKLSSSLHSSPNSSPQREQKKRPEVFILLVFL